MTEQTITYNVRYSVQNIDQSIHSTQRLLYATNALRLSIVDIQRLSTDPSLGHLFWAGIQLTRTWRLLYNLVKATNQAQRIGVAQSVMGRGGVGRASGIMGYNLAMRGLFGEIPQAAGGVGLGGSILALAAANPVLAAGALLAITVSALGYRKFFMDRKLRSDKREFIQKQREIAKTQGYEW